MKQTERQIMTRRCMCIGEEDAPFRLIQPIDGHEAETLAREAEEIAARTDAPFCLVAFPVGDWNRALSPWEAPPVFGREPFGGGAPQTLSFLEDELLAALPAISGPTILGGYSLAGLFALWAGYRSDRFAAVAAASPSVWFPGWLDFAAENEMRARFVYLSLGDREERARNPVMARVGDCIRAYHEALTARGIPAALEWNEGNHFRDAPLRTAKAFAWCIHRLR